MSEPKFTPGPVSSYPGGSTGGVPKFNIANREYVETENKRAVMNVAAPEMYAALKRCAYSITNHESGHHTEFQEALKQALAAIAKAEGRPA